MKTPKRHPPARLHLVRDVLDSLVTDRQGQRMGRVDRIVLVVEDVAPPRVARIETGGAALAERLSPRLGWAARLLGSRFGPHRGKPVRFAFSKVLSLGMELRLDVDKKRSPASLWERWLRQNFTRRIPTLKRP